MIGNATAVHTRRWALAYRDAGHEVCVISIRSATIPGVDVSTIAVGPVNTPSRLWTFASYLRLAVSIRRTVRSWKPDVVNPHFVTTNGTLAGIAGVHPIVLTAWGSDVIPADGKQIGALTKQLNRWAISRADRVTATNDFLAGWVTTTSPDAIVDIVPFGVDTALFHARSRTERPEGPFTVGIVKSLEPRYGIDVAIRAVADVVRTIPDTRLIIAGEGRERASLETLVEDLHLGTHVTFVGIVPHDDVPALMGTFDVLVNPTVVPESFGVVVLEGSAMELPVVATDVGGVPDVCIDGTTGILVPARDPAALANAIVLLASKPDLRGSMGVAGRSFVEDRFDWAASVDTMLGVLESAVGDR